MTSCGLGVPGSIPPTFISYSGAALSVAQPEAANEVGPSYRFQSTECRQSSAAGHALRFKGRERVQNPNEIMAKIVAERLVENWGASASL